MRTPRSRLLLGDAEEVLKRFASGSIDCCVTSPPYYRSRRYRISHRREIGQERTLDAYVRRLASTGREILRVMKSRGSLWLVLGDTWRAGRWLGVPWRVAFALGDIGWMLRDAVIWHDPEHVVKGTRDRLASAHEVVFHFVKGGHPYYNKASLRGAGARADVWTVTLERPTLPGFPFSRVPEVVVERAIKATCPPRGVVMDPFVGSGTTVVAALRLGRSAVGIDISRDYLEIARGRILRAM